MPRGVYDRKKRTTTETPTDSSAPAEGTPPRRRRRRRHQEAAPAAGSTNGADYGAVLADLRAHRDRIDAAIASLEVLVG
jgi:hypothetical protein